VIFEQENYLNGPLIDKYKSDYPEEWIRNYCSNPEVSEHQSSLWGNFSAPIEVYDNELYKWIESNVLPDLKIKHLMSSTYKHDHFFVNFHMDEPQSFLEVHNDLKGFRWLITSQLYLNDNQGVICIENEKERAIPCYQGYFYSISATPFSWHYVPDLTELKKSILFRVGKKKHRTVAHPSLTEPAWLIVNDNHSDSHYAKLGLRMGNLTEAWLHKLGKKNIYHTEWRKSYSKVENVLKEKHKEVNVINSGEFLGLGNIQLTDDNINDYAEQMMNINNHNTMWTKLEKVLKEYTDSSQHMIYKNFFLK